jgi:hypothetical protein
MRTFPDEFVMIRAQGNGGSRAGLARKWHRDMII